MAVLDTDIEVHLSGGGSNSDPDASIGGAISSETVDMSTILHNLLDKVIGDESADGNTNFRIVYFRIMSPPSHRHRYKRGETPVHHWETEESFDWLVN